MSTLTLKEVRKRINARRAELNRLGASSVSVFGSFAKEEQHPESDLDLVIELLPGFGYFDLGEIKARLDAYLGVPVNPVLAGKTTSSSSFYRESVRVF